MLLKLGMFCDKTKQIAPTIEELVSLGDYLGNLKKNDKKEELQGSSFLVNAGPFLIFCFHIRQETLLIHDATVWIVRAGIQCI